MAEKIRPLILVTNDDGIVAPGIKALVEVASELGEVIVVAPDSPQSGQGHAITLELPLRLKEVSPFDDVKAYECSGTPADCVKLGRNIILKGRSIDLCVSGINHGSNSSINVIYSGTMSAAMEASLYGVNSIGFSLLNFSFDADFTEAKRIARSLMIKALDKKFPDCSLLNVNIPNVEKVQGIKICRQGRGTWVEDFQESEDPRGQKYYWMKGSFETDDNVEGTDIWALKNGYASVVPTGHDLTVHKAIEHLDYLSE